MNVTAGCSNWTVAEGQCWGLSVCGYCYDYGETRVVSRTYETFNLVSRGLMNSGAINPWPGMG